MSDNNITKSNISTSEQLFAEIRQILIGARQTAYKAVNFAMVTAYWNIGRLIVEDEQQGSTRAEYGKAVLADLSVRLTEEFGKGFTEANLRNMRQFYQYFPNCYALRSELTWTHYRLLIRVQDEDARQWYMNEAESRRGAHASSTVRFQSYITSVYWPARTLVLCEKKQPRTFH